jgi:glycosyltransferase involved in cell wall biosynthesis
MRSLETRVCSKVNQVAVIARGLKDDMLKRGIHSEKLTVVPNGVSLDDFNVSAPDLEYRRMWKLERKKVIGFIGSFFRYEGLDLLIEALGRLASVRADTVLLLVGEGRMATALNDQIKQLRLENAVIMPGRIPHSRVPGVYALMDIVVYPRYSIRLTELTTPLKPLEAMAMNKAVVASDIGGHRELIRNDQTGLLFPAGDVAALAEALRRLLENTELRRKLADEGATWVRRERSWDRTTAAYSEVYRRALDKQSSFYGQELNGCR